jgi:hypothetical protein
MSSWIVKESCEHGDMPYLENFHFDESNRLTLVFSFKNGDKKIHFDDHWVFRMIDEGKALETLYGQKFDGSVWMFMAEHSDLIDWFDKESAEFYKDEYKHFVILTQHYIFEVLSQEAPQITTVE